MAVLDHLMHQFLFKLILLLLLLQSSEVAAEFGAPGCNCQPHHPQHPQMAFCRSDFVLKVRIQSVQIVSNTSEQVIFAKVKRIFKLHRKLHDLRQGLRIVLHVASLRDSCGQVTFRQPNAPLISRSLHAGSFYLVTGHSISIGNRSQRLQLSVCSWVSYWPRKRDRRRLLAIDDQQQHVSRLQARYLRRGLYADGCRSCQIEDIRLTNSAVWPTARRQQVCQLHTETDYNMCHARFSYCQYYKDIYTGWSGCQWHTASPRAYRNCIGKNFELDAIRLGVNA